jgi:hypothetical protein
LSWRTGTRKGNEVYGAKHTRQKIGKTVSNVRALDEQIIDEIAAILRRPSDRETERHRYTAYLIEGVCTWLTPREIDSMPAAGPIPLFGGPPDEHYPRQSDQHVPRSGVSIEDLGCTGCLYLYNNTGTDHTLVYDDCKGENLIAKARRGDRDADAILCIIAEKHIGAGAPIPQHLGQYVCEVLWGRADGARYNEGGNRHMNFTRNVKISWAAGLLDRCYGINDKTRVNRLLQEALKKIGVHISTDGIRQILRRGQRQLPLAERIANQSVTRPDTTTL